MLSVVSIIISVFAGLLQFFGYISYSKNIVSEKIIPNTASWFIWAMGGIATTISYIVVAGDLVKDILPIVCTLSGMFIFAFCLVKGRFEKIDSIDWIIILLDIGITIYWYLSKETVIANFLYLFAEFTSFIPIVRYVWKNPLSENATPWVLWSTAYFLMGIVVVMRYEKWEDLFYPVILFTLHVVVATLSSDYLIKRRMARGKRFETAIDAI